MELAEELLVGDGPRQHDALVLAGQLAVVATEDLAAGAEAPYGGVVGPAATLATACDLGPLEQVGYWRWLIYREEDETVLLPFVDELRNPACFINDAQGPKRRGGDAPFVLTQAATC